MFIKSLFLQLIEVNDIKYFWVWLLSEQMWIPWSGILILLYTVEAKIINNGSKDFSSLKNLIASKHSNVFLIITVLFIII